MPERINGGVFYDEVVTGLLRHFVITGADFSGAQDSEGRPIQGSAAEVVFTEITRKSTVVIMNPLSQVDRGMSFALESNRADWTVEELQIMLNCLGSDVGVDHVDLTSVLIEEVPYDFTVGASMRFTDLIDTPSNYPSGSAGDRVAVEMTEDGLVFTKGGNVYIPISSPTDPIEIGERYFITAPITVTLPDYSSAMVGDTVRIGKAVSVTAVIQGFGGTQLINTDIGSDTDINYDISEELIFAFDGSGWSLQIGSIL